MLLTRVPLQHFNRRDVNMRMSLTLFLGTVMAGDPQPACESHASASHVVSPAPAQRLAEGSARSLVISLCAAARASVAVNC